MVRREEYYMPLSSAPDHALEVHCPRFKNAEGTVDVLLGPR